MSYFRFKDMDQYDTPAGIPVSGLFRLTGKSRWYFYAYNFGIFCRSGALGQKGQLDQQNQIRLSSENIDLIERCGGHIHLRGLNNLKALNGKPVVLAGNHMSLLETAVLHAIIREYVDFSFIVKESLLKVPYFRDILFALHAVAVTRENPREDLKTVLTEGKKRLDAGQCMIVFPQAHRSTEFDPEKFNTIAVKLARHAGVPVMPVALKTDFLGNGRFLRDLGPVHPEKDVYFEFGEPMDITGNGSEQQKKIVEFISSRVKTWRDAESEGAAEK